jgi:hypothetical protein
VRFALLVIASASSYHFIHSFIFRCICQYTSHRNRSVHCSPLQTMNAFPTAVVNVHEDRSAVFPTPTTPASFEPATPTVPRHQEPLGIRGILICAAYCVLSSGCVLHNKFLLSSIFPHENSLLLAQNVFTITLLLVLSSPLVLRAPAPLSALHVPLTLYHSPGDWVIGLCYSLNVLTGIWCLGYLSVPMFSSIKRCNVIVVWMIEVVWAPTATTWPTVRPLLTLMAGTVLMSYYDLQFSALGYVFGALSCVFQSVSFELGKRLVNHGKDLWSVLLINSLVSTAVQLAYMVFADELPLLHSALSFLFGGDGLMSTAASGAPLFLTPLRKGSPAAVAATLTPERLWVHLLLNAVLITMMNYVIFLNCSVNSPLAHTVTGNVKGLVTVISGAFLFSVPLRAMAAVGITVGFLGGCWFSWIKFDHHRKKVGQVSDACPKNGEGRSGLQINRDGQINEVDGGCSSRNVGR